MIYFRSVFSMCERKEERKKEKNERTNESTNESMQARLSDESCFVVYRSTVQKYMVIVAVKVLKF